MLASCSGDRTVRIWSFHADAGEWQCDSLLEEEEHDRTIRAVSWSPDGRCLATASFDASTAIWRIQDNAWELVATLEGHENEVKSVAWAPTGTMIATCGRDRSVWIWESLPDNEFEVIDVKQGHSQDVKMVAWHPDGELLVSASYDDSIKLWRDVGDEWECVQTLSGPGLGHSSTVWAVAFNQSGSRMVSCSDDTSLKVWRDTKSKFAWKLEETLSGHHQRTVFSVDWSAGDVIASGAGDNSICVFRPSPTEADSAAVNSSSRGASAISAVSPDDGSAAKGSADAGAAAAAYGQTSPAAAAGSIAAQHQQLQQGRQSYQLLARRAEAHAADVNCVRWHPVDHSLLASAGDDNEVKLWRLRV